MELSDDQTAILAEHTIELWNNSPELNDKTIGVILDQQQISSKTIDAILSL
jgi:hypothetical protein